MITETRVLLIEDDFYAIHWMEMMLRRDWRTRVIGVIQNPRDLSKALMDINAQTSPVHLVVVDTDIPNDEAWLTESLKYLAKYTPQSGIVFTGVSPNPRIARLRSYNQFRGYLLKGEIRYSLAWAVSLAAEGHLVLTPGVRSQLETVGKLPSGALVLDGHNPVNHFTSREMEAIRLAFFFSMERRDLADELGITENYAYQLVSTLYEKMGLIDVLQGEMDPIELFGSHPAVLSHLKATLENIQRAGKRKIRSKLTRDQETLAFHFLTLPAIGEVP